MDTYTGTAKQRCLEALRKLATLNDPETAHAAADDRLLELIDDAEISAAYNAIKKWYS